MQQPTLNLRRVDALAAAADILCHFRLSRHILPGCGDGERWWAEVICEAGHCDDVVAVVSGRQTWLWVPQSSQMYTPSSTWLNDSLSQTRHRAGIERGRRGGRRKEGGKKVSVSTVEWTHLRLLVCVAPGAGVWGGMGVDCGWGAGDADLGWAGPLCAAGLARRARQRRQLPNHSAAVSVATGTAAAVAGSRVDWSFQVCRGCATLAA